VSKLESVLDRKAPADPAGEARRQTESAARSRPFRWLVRAGFVARAITYGVIAALTLALALGAGTMGTAPNQQGALALIARDAFGRVALVVIAAGLLAYALWKLFQGVFGRGPEGGGSSDLKDRIGNLAGGVVYGAFFVVAIRVLTGSAGNSSSEPKRTAAGVLGWPGGQEIVGICGAGLIAISLYQLYDAVTGGFAEESKTQQMDRAQRRVFMTLGHVGLTARALVFTVVGYFLLRTAIEFNPNSAVGVDGALARLHHEPLGPWILGLVAAGLLVFAVFSLLEARYRRL
jgi:Domain of Unknown Function (DUF1206)